MNTNWSNKLWQQFGAAIDMLANALSACPDELWQAPLWDERGETRGYAEFWYLAYHALFWLDLYLTGSVEGFAPPEPFTLDELDPAGVLPERLYTREELLTYLQHGRQKCHATIEALTETRVDQECKFSWGRVKFGELLLYNMRHVQEHASQLSLFLGQKTGSGPGWVAKAKEAEI
jgi:hypothetical protein